MADADIRIADHFEPVTLEDWHALLEKDLKGASLDSLRTKVDANLELAPLYTAADVPASAAEAFPGAAPFTRGADALAREGAGWALCQEYDDPRMDACGAAIAEDLSRGVEAVWLRCGTVQGTRVATPADLGHALAHVDLGTTPVYLDAAHDGLGAAGALIALAESRGIDPSTLRGGFGLDPLGALASTGHARIGLRRAFDAMTSLGARSAESYPGMRSVLADSRAYADGGATDIHELAFVIATGLEYVRALLGAGLDIDAAAGEVQFALTSRGNVFVQIAKLRAARQVWAKVIRAAGGSEDAQRMRLHVRTARYDLTIRDPWVNMLRGTAQSFAAAVAGADTVATLCFDAAVGPSDALGRRVARNTQLLLREESHLHRVVDAAGGSYCFEALTDQIARAAWAEFQAIEAKGGMTKALKTGYVGNILKETSAQRDKAAAKRKHAIVGVNEFPNLEEAPLQREMISLRDVEVELGDAFGPGDQDALYNSLIDVAQSAADESAPAATLADKIIASSRLGVDLYSLEQVLAAGQPEFHAPPMPGRRRAAGWERLRDQSDAMLAGQGRRPTALLVQLGSVAEHTARATWIANLLAAAGIDVERVDGADLDGLRGKTGYPVAVVVGPDSAYAEGMTELVAALRGAGVSSVQLAGRPGDAEAAHREAGVDDFLFVGQDVHARLVALYAHYGVSA